MTVSFLGEYMKIIQKYSCVVLENFGSECTPLINGVGKFFFGQNFIENTTFEKINTKTMR